MTWIEANVAVQARRADDLRMQTEAPLQRPLQAICSATSGSLSNLQVRHVLSTFSFKSFDSFWAAIFVLTRFQASCTR
jgi:hypothetical protein